MEGGGLAVIVVIAVIVLICFYLARLICRPFSAKARNKKLLEKIASLEVVYLDTETTGLKAPPKDEIVEIAIIDDAGKILLNSLVKPTYRKRWNDAQDIHGITPKMVADAPTLEELAPQIEEAIRGKHLVIYNAKYDMKYLEPMINAAEHISCCMLCYGRYIGEWNDRHNHYKWHKLTAAAKKAGHVWEGDAHRALADTQATRTVWHWLKSKKAIF